MMIIIIIIIIIIIMFPAIDLRFPLIWLVLVHD